MRIDTDIQNIIVEIDDVEYVLAEKTVAVAEKLQKIETDAIKAKNAVYTVWMNQLEVLLGKQAMKALFPKGKGENLDRMEMIYAGVMEAFDHNGKERKSDKASETVDELSQVAKQLKPLTDLLNAVANKPETKNFPTIGREK